MVSLLLAIIYISFISLGLPDSLLGSAWPVMRVEFGAPLSFAGMVSMIITGGTIVSSLMSDRLNRRLGTGLVTAISVGMTAAALLGFSFVTSAPMLCLWAIPYGLGAGAVDAALNNYVALHYSGRHMSWLHCFWGVGATVSPYIMSTCLNMSLGWRSGYRTVSVVQFVLTAFLVLSIPLWKKRAAQMSGAESEQTKSTDAKPLGLVCALKIRGVPQILLAFFLYCSMETTAGLWACTYFVEGRGVAVETASSFTALYYIGMTAGRFVNGFAADRLGDKLLIRIGSAVVAAGTVMVILPFESSIPALVGLLIIGIGCAPIYPSIIHATPHHFGAENSQAIVGIQMASAYAGSTIAPPIFGLIAAHVDVGLYGVYLMLLTVGMVVMTERLNSMMKGK